MLIKSAETKRRLIEETYKMIVENGAENIRARDLAARVGCSAPAIYKHYPNMDHLISLATIFCMENYFEELSEFLNDDRPVLETAILIWKLFNKYAFLHPYAYLKLFWNNDEAQLEEIFYDYFSLYPLKSENDYSAFLYSSIFSGNIEDRDYVWFRRAEAQGQLRSGEAICVSKINCLICKGLLEKYVTDGQKPEDYIAVVNQCNDLIEHNVRVHIIRK